MKKFLLFISFCLMATVYNVASAAEEVLWAEDFSSYAANAVPTGGTYNYACTGSGTKVYTSNISAGAPTSSSELLIAKNGGIFSATIPLNGKSGNMTLSFYTNDAKRITITATGATLGENTYSNNLCTYPVTVAEGTKNLTLEFKNTNSKNVRFDDVKLFQIIEGEPTEPTQVATPTFSPASGTSVKYGSTVTVSSDEGTKLVVSYGDVLLEEVGTNKKDITLPDENSGKTEYIIEAYAVDINGKLGDSETAKATYTLYNENVADIAAFLTAADAVNARTIKSDATVVWKESNKKLYVKDHSGWLLLYSNAGAFTDEYINGDVIKAGYKGTYLLSKNNPEMSEPENIVKGEAVDPIAPTEVSSLTDYDACFCNEYIVLKKVTLNASNSREVKATFEDGSTVIVYSSTAVTYDGTKFYDVEGFKLLYNTKKEVTPKEITEITIPATVVETPTTTAADKMLYGAKFTISTSTEGAILMYNLNGSDETYASAEGSSITLNAPTEGESFTIKAYAVDPTGILTQSETLEKTVTLYPPTPATALIDEITIADTKVTGTAYKPFSNVIKYGAEYAGKCAKGYSSIQFNNKLGSSGVGSAIFMTQSVGNVNKVVVDWNSNTTNGRKLQVYGQNTPYEAYGDQNKYIGDDAVKGDLLGTIVYGTSTELYITGEYQYILVMEAGDGPLYLNSIQFIWNNPFTGSETTYNKENGLSNIKENKFVTLVDTQNGKALSRKDADTGTIVGAAATVNTDESNGGNFITLNQNQIFIDEFQLVPVAEGGFKLYGGTPFIRRYIGYDDATGLTTTADEASAAVVKFVQYGDGIVAQFTDGDYIVSDGTNFGKGTPTGTEAPASLAEGATLVPAYVFVSKGNNSTGVEDIEMVETEAPAQYYNLNGVEVKAGNLVPGIYIVRQGNKVSKQFIR